jgi:hypothetical protein
MLIFGATVGGNKMGLFDKIKNVLGDVAQPTVGKVAPVTEGKKKTQVKQPKVAVGKPSAPPAAVKKPRAKKKAKVVENPAKIAANKAGEPWVAVLGIDVNKDDPGMGAFELDWNDIFVARLIKAGYQGKTDQDIVDNWFQSVCRNVVLETYEQEQADPEKRASNSNRRDLGNGRTEVS